MASDTFFSYLQVLGFRRAVQAQLYNNLPYFKPYWCLILSKNGKMAAQLETTAYQKIRIWKFLVSQWKSAE